MSSRGKKQGRVGRADLLAFGLSSDRGRRLAAFAGFDWQPSETSELEVPPDEVPPDEDKQPPIVEDPEPKPDPPPYEPDPLSVFAPTVFTPIEPQSVEPEPTVEFTPDWPNAPTAEPVFLPLADVAHLRRLLARFDPGRREGRAIDEPRLVRKISRADPIARLPHRRFPGRRGVQLVADRSVRLAPFWRDQRFAFEVLSGPHTHLWRYDESDKAFLRVGEDMPSLPQPDDGPLVVFGDLGAFGGAEDRRFWRGVAQDFLRKGGEVLAIVPCSTDDVPRELARLWSPEPWEAEASAPDPRPRREQVERLLTLAAPLSRLEPGLLRSLRRRCTGSPPVVELLLWRDEALASSHVGAASFDPEIMATYRERFYAEARKEPAAFAEVWNTVREWRGRIGAEFMFEEIRDLPDDVRKIVVASAEDRHYAEVFWRAIGAAVERETLQSEAVRWLCEAGFRRPMRSSELWRDPVAKGALRRAIPLLGAAEPRPMTVFQRGGMLHVGDRATGSPLAIAHSTDGVVEIEPFSPPSLPPPLTVFRDRLPSGAPAPEMIAIPTGSFLMGSPEDEAERDGNEGPQHPVEITELFALAKYPVTFEEYDAFCEATGREAPDDRGWGRGRRPAINVGWEDARDYCDWLSAETGEAYRLPSEAEWEYACRAGTPTRYWWGDDWEPARANGGGEVGETTEVGRYDANPWGLCDTHGNVWEWCEDRWRGDYEQQRTQQAFAGKGEANRVFRGGSWYDDAGSCRAAFRFGLAPDLRLGNLGFRPARGQATGALAGSGGAAGAFGPARGAVSGANGKRPGRGESSPPQGGGDSEFSPPEPIRRRVTPGGGASIPLADLPPAPFVIRTDRAELVIQRITRSDLGAWASGMGRDRYGLWADFTVDDIRQRLRWCRPGRFTMGSPVDDPGYKAIQAQVETYKGAEEPQTEITLEQGFWLFDTAVTVAQWRAFMAAGGHEMPRGAYAWNGKEWNFDKDRGWDDPGFKQSEDAPVTCVGWDDARDYIDWLNDRLGGIDLRLPSEAEWEYACRAGSQTPFEPNVARAFAGADIGVDEVNYDGDHPIGEAPKAEWRERTVPAKGAPFRPNAWGLWHMHGNVYELCEDVWHGSHEGAAPDGSPRPASRQDGVASRVIRGGSWYDDARYCRAAYRNGDAPDNRRDDLGFRPARGQARSSGKQESAERSGLRSGGGREAEPRPERSEGPPPRGGGESIFSRAENRLGLGKDKD